MGFLDLFRKSHSQRLGTWQELGSYQAQFSAFGSDIYKSDMVRACIRPLAEHSSKANAVCTNESIAKTLNSSPNLYMNGKSFLYKVRTRLELYNTAFILITRDDRGKAVGFYPVPYQRFEALQDAKNNLYIKFYFANSSVGTLVASWKDLAVLRKDYNTSDIAGDDNRAVYALLDLINTSNQGVGNAVKATANLRGILKSTKAMLSDEDIKKQKDRFVKDYLSLENEGGIASLDSTQEFTPISMNPTVTSWETMKEFRENLYRYFGISDAIVTSNYTESQMDSFYDSRIEPFLVDLSEELTRKVFTEREIGFGAEIVYESNRIQYTSTSTKLAMVSLVDRGALTPNEWRAIFNLAPVEGGDVPIRRLDTATVEQDPKEDSSEEGENNGQTE